MILLSALSAFGAGLLASLSPCVYPMIPVTLGFIGSQSKNEKKYTISLFGFLLGQILVMTALGVVTVKIGETLGFTAEDPAIRISVGILLIVFGMFSATSWLPKIFDRINLKTQKIGEGKKSGFVSALIIGMSTALLTSPCTTPILSGILAIIASSQSMLTGAFLMLSFSIGFVFIFGILGMGVLRIKSLPKAGAWMNYAHKLGALLLIILGVYYIYSAIYL